MPEEPGQSVTFDWGDLALFLLKVLCIVVCSLIPLALAYAVWKGPGPK
jgi:multidrug transporter EmrE-like cation transporter